MELNHHDELPNLTPCLPNDITLEILVLLPVKSLVRFSCTDKSWQKLIFSNQHHFVKAHLENQAPPRTVLMTNSRGLASCGRRCNQIPDRESKKFFEKVDHRGTRTTILSSSSSKGGKPFLDLGNRLSLVGCCDGVFCILKDCDCFADSKIYLWNPALRQCTLLPRSLELGGYRTTAVGFGFDPISKDYKVAKLYTTTAQVSWENHSNSVSKVDTYSLKNHSWTTILSRAHNSTTSRNPLDLYNPPGRNQLCVILNGYLYGIGGIGWRNKQYNIIINKIHLSRGDLHSFFLPSYVTVNLDYKLGLYKGCLSISGFPFIQMQNGGGRTAGIDLELWTMKESANDNEWVKQFVIVSRKLGIKPLHRMPHHRIMTMTDITSGGKILAHSLEPAPPRRRRQGPHDHHDYNQDHIRRLVLYDPESQTIEDVQPNGVPCYAPISLIFPYFVADNYVESLVSVVPPEHFKKILPKRKTKIFSRKLKLFGCFVLN